MNIKVLIIGILFLPFRRFLKPQKGLWLFGADKGRKYAQNSKYLFEYILENHLEISAYWVTESPIVYRELRNKGIPVLNILSLKGAYYSLKAELKVESTWFSDILYTFPYQKVAYLMHGMPIKKIYYDDKKRVVDTIMLKIKKWLSKIFVLDYKLEYSCFTPVSSSFFKDIVSKAMNNDSIFLTGQPRTDSFLHLDANVIKKKYGIDKNAFVVTYMPTHRAYGAGEPSPHIFIDDINAINFFKENNIVVVWKQHINMLKKYKKEEADACFKELSFDYLVDSQELLFISDLLITDFSSCFVDFMLLKRPILFYHYDDYEKNDNDLYYGSDILSQVGKISNNEADLLEDVKSSYLNGFDDKHTNLWSLFNVFFDDKSCERCFAVLKKQIEVVNG